MTILYKLGDSLYVNVTNKCPCACKFCIRIDHDNVNGEDNLWLPHDPSVEEIIEDFKNFCLEDYKELVFCGYGEPLIRIHEVIEVCKYVRSMSDIKIRVNTNGLSDLIHKKPTAHLLKGYVDGLSISLNAPTKEAYLEIVRPRFGIESFDAVLKFAEEAKEFIEDITFSVVDIIPKEQIEACRRIATERNIKFRIRTFIE
ncbi:TIGR04100 family radical SAM protein [Sporanaerobium hydrogeniformans]|uniref:TIGR04100 family radical SAM protein n=1 Tax=Sporanaerobium hydrogeniformans TaxID=3072179 RepID=A0AC61D8V4_9FIRM|nr:TIGR04100 family radical SAM protein [Sporanaerobium hydrogeniformans]PHV69206.1 TIGR04100 family radical SAM protein [Sporanaerobium hydrogeniformans]